MSTFTYTAGNAKSMKGGLLMKSKHIADGKEVAICDFRGDHISDNLLKKQNDRSRSVILI